MGGLFSTLSLTLVLDRLSQSDIVSQEMGIKRVPLSSQVVEPKFRPR